LERIGRNTLFWFKKAAERRECPQDRNRGGFRLAMAKLTVGFGVILIVLGGASFFLTGHRYPTSLIPAAFGILLAVFGSLAESPDQKRRMLMMHIAVTLGLLGFLGTVTSLISIVQLWQGKAFPYPAAIEEKAAMALLMLIFVILCVRSFIAARRARA
jgi:hypothetical protein